MRAPKDVLCPPEARVIDELLSDARGPGVGETTVVRVMVPTNPLRLVIVIRLVRMYREADSATMG